MTSTKRYVVVTTARGVFAGHLVKYAEGGAVLTDAQMCLYWHETVKGVLGLAVTGPNAKCRVSPAVPRICVPGVTSVMDATPAAEAAWKVQPWA